MDPVVAASADRQLSILRDLLSRDYLAMADWDHAVRDLAQMVRVAVEAQEAMVAIWDAGPGAWEATTSQGRRLRDAQIRERASLSALERARETLRAEFTTGDALLQARTESVHRQRIEGLLVAPLFFWDVTQDRSERRFGGCLYAHRTSEREPFSEVDVALVNDIARIAEPVLNLLRHARQMATDLEASRTELAQLRQRSAELLHFGRFHTRDPWMAKNVLEPLRLAAGVDKVGILILGPTGSGKGHLAETYHHECPRRDRPFIVLNCGSFRSAAILGPELFGFAPDSGYSNAPRRGRPGKAQIASGGTLFLDEIGCMPMELQPQLLRLIDQGRYTPLGGNEEKAIDIQVIAATNEDLLAKVRDGVFREDLYWRLCDVVIAMPPLTERLLDIEDIAGSLLARAIAKTRRSDLHDFSEGALQALLGFDWARAGNIRGLEKTIERSVILAPAGATRISRKRLVFHSTAEAPSQAAPYRAPSRAERELSRVKEAIREHGKATAAAEALGLTYRELYWKLQKAGLSVHRILLDRDEG